MNDLLIKSISCSDVDLRVWEPGDANDVFLGIEIEIGEYGADASDLFQFVVCTPEGLAARPVADGTSLIGDRAMLVVRRFDWNEVRLWIETTVHSSKGKDWVTSVWNLQKYFRWEYEDYLKVEESK